MKRFITMTALLTFALVACPQTPAPIVQPPPVLEQPFKPVLLGSLTVQLGGEPNLNSAKFTPVQLQNQTLTQITDGKLTFSAQPSNTFDASTTERFIVAPFKVTNTTNAALSNITLVAYSKLGNVGGSAFKDIQTFTGVVPPVDVNTLKPIHAMAGSASVVVDNANADLQIFKRSEITTLTAASSALLAGGEGILNYGFIARKGNTGTYRTIPGTICGAAPCNEGKISLALRVPKNSDAGSSGAVYRYSMTFLIFSDSLSRVTESLEEQGTTNAATRATALTGGASIASMCGTSQTTSTFIPGVRTVGVGTDTAWMGGDFFDSTETALNLAGIVGNTEKTYSGTNGVLNGRFTALGGATLSAAARAIGSATTTNGGNIGIVAASGDTTIRPKVNSRVADGFTYQISDGSCTSPNIAATITAPDNTVWYIDSGASAGGDGRSNAPFQNASSLNVIATPTTVTAVNDFIYFKGNSSNTTGLVLKNGQQAIGSGEALVVNSVTLQAVGTAPTIQTPVTVATGNTIKGLTFGGLNGTVGGTLTVSNASIAAGTTRAISLSGGTLAVSLTKVDSSGGTNNISLTNTAGTFSISGTGTTAGSGGTLSGATSDGIVVNGAASVTIKNLNLSGSQQHGINWTASSGSSALTLTKVAVSSIGSSSPSVIGNGLLGVMSGTATGTLTIDGSSSFSTAQQSGIDISTTTGTTAVLKARITGSSFTNNGVTQVNVNFYANAAGSFAEVSSNTVTGTPSAISVATQSTSSTQARVNSNTINNSNGIGIGIELLANGTGNLIAESNTNTITNGGQYGIRGDLDVVGGRLDLTTTGNNITQTSANAITGMLLNMASATSNSIMCVRITGNTISNSGSSGSFGLRVRTRPGAVANTLQIQGITPSPATSQAAVESYLTTNNTVTASPATPVSMFFSNNVASATCNAPTF